MRKNPPTVSGDNVVTWLIINVLLPQLWEGAPCQLTTPNPGYPFNERQTRHRNVKQNPLLLDFPFVCPICSVIYVESTIWKVAVEPHTLHAKLDYSAAFSTLLHHKWGPRADDEPVIKQDFLFHGDFPVLKYFFVTS